MQNNPRYELGSWVADYTSVYQIVGVRAKYVENYPTQWVYDCESTGGNSSISEHHLTEIETPYPIHTVITLSDNIAIKIVGRYYSFLYSSWKYCIESTEVEFSHAQITYLMDLTNND